MMKKIAFFLVITIALCFFGVGVAQEKVRSLKIKQYEIEEGIRNSLKHYLEPHDYVLKVMLQGRQVTTNVIDESLPGFGPIQETDKPPAPTGETFWEVTQMRIDLVMHKEISPSISTYLTEIIPVLSGLNPQRGDMFNFVPIAPKPLPPPPEKTADKEGILTEMDGMDAVSSPGALSFIWTLSVVEWVLITMTILLFILLIWVLWKINKLQASNEKQVQRQKETNALQSASNDLITAPQQALTTIAQAREDLVKHQSEQMQEVLIKDENERLKQEILKQLIGRDDWKKQLIQEMTKDKPSMEILTRLLAILGREPSRKLFANIMEHNTYLELEKMSQEVSLTTEEANGILKNVWMFLLTKKLVAPEQLATDPFNFLKNLTTNQIGFLIKEESTKIKAIVISRLDSEQAAKIMHGLSKDDRTQVAIQLGRMSELPLELIEQVAFNLADKAREVPDDATVALNGVEFVADVLGDADPVTRQELINGIRVSDQKLSEDIESRSFIFDSIPAVPRDVLVEVVRKLHPEDVITAISGATKEIQESVILCFPEQNRRTLISSLKAKKPSPAAIKEKRKVFVQSMRQMALENKVDLKEINSTWERQTSPRPALNYKT